MQINNLPGIYGNMWCGMVEMQLVQKLPCVKLMLPWQSEFPLAPEFMAFILILAIFLGVLDHPFQGS